MRCWKRFELPRAVSEATGWTLLTGCACGATLGLTKAVESARTAVHDGQ
jgi:hypothetical protein